MEQPYDLFRLSVSFLIYLLIYLSPLYLNRSLLSGIILRFLLFTF